MGCSCSSKRDKSDSFFYEVCPDYKELSEYTGEGLKHTHTWQGTITKAELHAKRELFWMTRNNGYSIVWMYIRQAVEADASNTQAILESAGAVPVNDSIELCKDYDGNIYKVPIFVINDPVSFTQDKNFSSKEIKLVLRSLKGDVNVMAQLDWTVKRLKEEACLLDYVFYFNGKQMLDQRQLYEFNLEDEMVLIYHNRKPV